MKIISEENRVGICEMCSLEVRDMLLVKSKDKYYFYACLDCLGKGHSRVLPMKYSIEKVDEEKLAREKALDILVDLAEEDEFKFDDRRLSVVKSFEDDIVDGSITTRLENYLNFHGNELSEVLKVRSYALKALEDLSIDKNCELVELYKKSRIEKWSSSDRNRLKLLMSDLYVQNLDVDNRTILENIDLIISEINKENSSRKYDNLEDIKKIIRFYKSRLYLTEEQLKRLKGFYNEMLRRGVK